MKVCKQKCLTTIDQVYNPEKYQIMNTKSLLFINWKSEKSGQS